MYFLVLNYLFFNEEITLYPPEVSTHFHFCLQSLKCDTLPPPKLLNCGNLTHLTYLFPKYPQHNFFKKKKKKSKKKTKKQKTGWPATLAYIYIFFWVVFFFGIFLEKKKKKSVGGILGINRSNGLNCYNLKVWGVKCHILNFGGKSENGWILQGGKV
jgi:hypothetical protein